MYAISSNTVKMFNFDHVLTVTISVKIDATVIMVTLTSGETKTLERYATLKEAQEAMASLFAAIAAGKEGFIMPDSVLKYGEKIVKDARVARRGGS
nr:MAG TPA: hypothetical protein [Caudoviricetes sp.]